MTTRLIAFGLAAAVVVVLVLAEATGQVDPCLADPAAPSCPVVVATPKTSAAPQPSGKPTTVPTTMPPASPGASPILPTTPPASPLPPPVYTFRDEFSGTRLRSDWGSHWPGFGDTLWSRNQVSVGDGVLKIKARQQGKKWVSGLIDTVGTFTQKYGVFSARMKIVEGDGLWPAFWLGQPQNAKREEAEIDVMEVCANRVGVHDGNDITFLHHYVHKADGSHAYAIAHRVANLAGDWHVYTVDWRQDHMTFYFDGIETSTFTSDTDISNVRMAVLLDLAVGGRFCGDSSAATPASPTLLVDWVRVTR
jgi:beta-glucanase (GH16 family)